MHPGLTGCQGGLYLKNRKCIHTPSGHICDTALELMIAEETLREADEAFSLLRSDYHELQSYVLLLEDTIRSYGLKLPDYASLI